MPSTHVVNKYALDSFNVTVSQIIHCSFVPYPLTAVSLFSLCITVCRRSQSSVKVIFGYCCSTLAAYLPVMDRKESRSHYLLSLEINRGSWSGRLFRKINLIIVVPCSSYTIWGQQLPLPLTLRPETGLFIMIATGARLANVSNQSNSAFLCSSTMMAGLGQSRNVLSRHALRNMGIGWKAL